MRILKCIFTAVIASVGVNAPAGGGELMAEVPVDGEPPQTEIIWSLDKNMISVSWTAEVKAAGKVVQVGGGWDESGNIEGEMVLEMDGTVRGISATVEVATVWTENEALTRILRNPETGFFAVDEHPRATFVSTEIAELPKGRESKATHVVKGILQFNGVKKEIRMPAILEFQPGGPGMVAAFTLNRADFHSGLIHPPPRVFASDGDISNDLIITARIKPIPLAPIIKGVRVPRSEPLDFEKLPKSFSQTVEVFQVSFDMVLVPGDEARGIKPLYFGRKEVTWDEFLPWVCGKDVLPDTEKAVRLRVQRLRPSLPYGDITRGYGEKGYSALSMSRRSAELYCEWLSKQTGRKYRLPSEKEWEHLCRLGRRGKDGEPDEEEAKSTAVYKDTAWSQDAGELRPKPGGSKKPDALGLYDVMGNLAEWVTATGEDHVVRGGHFKSPRAELGQAGRLLEEDGSWDVEYAGAIKSLWWFVDANWVGFRLVCEP